MNNSLRIVIVGVLVAVAAAVVVTKQRDQVQTAAPASGPAAGSAPRPKLLDLGATKCIPCKMMAPILEELKEEYAGRMDVEFIDVWQNSGAGAKYGISSIPTQIFYDAAGKELFRHEGFFAKEDILAKCKELGMLATSSAPAS